MYNLNNRPRKESKESIYDRMLETGQELKTSGIEIGTGYGEAIQNNKESLAKVGSGVEAGRNWT